MKDDTKHLDDVTKRRLAEEVKETRGRLGSAAVAIEQVAAGNYNAITEELEKLGIPRGLPSSTAVPIGMAIGMMMAGGCTLEERTAIALVACEIELGAPYDCSNEEVTCKLPPQLLTDKRLIDTLRYLRFCRIGHAELVFGLEDHYGDDLTIPMTELRRRATDAFMFEINLFDQVGIPAHQ